MRLLVVAVAGSPARTRARRSALRRLTATTPARRGSTSGSTAREAIDPARVGPQGRVAQFVVQCTLSHAEYDDPIVYPDQPGMSHLHTFFGNELVDADPDYERVAGADDLVRAAPGHGVVLGAGAARRDGARRRAARA